jgi:enoyl-CoA hydratase/carnithine racemase
MADYQTIIYEKVEDKIFRITLNRPEKINALSPTLLAEFEQATQEYDADPEASVLIICGAGRGFCAGYDLAEVSHRSAVEMKHIGTIQTAVRLPVLDNLKQFA